MRETMRRRVRAWRDQVLADWRGERYIAVGTVLCLLTAAIVAAFYLNNPAVKTDPDTIGYLNAAQRILRHGTFVDAVRTPGYPFLIAVVYAIAGNGNLAALSAVQGAFFVLATVELYALTCLMLRRAWIGFAVGILCGANLQILSWVKPIIVEGTALWLTVTLALLVVLFIRAPRASRFWPIVACALVLFLTRPEWILIPVPLFLYLVIVAWRHGYGKRLLPHALIAVVLLYAVVGGYVYENGVRNGYAGISTTQNINMLGKVLQYRMQQDADPQDADITAAITSYANRGGYDPFEIMAEHPEFTYSRVGGYGLLTVEHHLPEFVFKSIPVILTSSNYFWEWSTVSVMGHFGRELLVLNSLSAQVYRTYRFFPIFALFWLALLFWRRTSRRQSVEMMVGISLLAVYELGMTVAGCYAIPAANGQGWIDYSRIHMPINPLLLAVIFGTLLLAAARLSAWLRAVWSARARRVSEHPAYTSAAVPIEDRV